jgi:PPOX class probable F420-dependent enzyme
MPSKRKEIAMTQQEAESFLEERHTMSVATIGPDGWPHVVAMFYGFLGAQPAFWTYRRAQKVMNLRRDPRITLLVEAGERYEELRGLQIKGRARILEDPESVERVGESVYERYMGPLDDLARQAVAKMGQKRVAVVVEAERLVSWDHRKLRGHY